MASEDSAAQRNPAELALELYNLLFPYPSDVRQKAIQSAMTSLGEAPVSQQSARAILAASASDSADFGDTSVGPKAIRWAQRHALTRQMLDEVFHLADERMEIIASSVPGANRREMAVNCYLLCGIRGLLMTDVPSLDESEAIAVCKRLTAYDKNNHTGNRAAVGNRMTGTRPTFTLTGPGEAAAAELIKQMTTTAGG